MRTPARIALVVAAIAVAAILFVVLRGTTEEEATEPPPAAETAVQTGDDETGTEPGDGETDTDTGEAESPPPPPPPAPDPDVVRAEIRIGAGGPSGIQRIEARQDQRVVLVVRSQIVDHVHVHGYDLFADVGPGQPARIQFQATVPGRFEIELEDRHQQIADLRVRP